MPEIVLPDPTFNAVIVQEKGRAAFCTAVDAGRKLIASGSTDHAMIAALGQFAEAAANGLDMSDAADAPDDTF